MYWWYVIYQEAFEFKSKYPEVPCIILKSKELFNFSKMDKKITKIYFDGLTSVCCNKLR